MSNNLHVQDPRLNPSVPRPGGQKDTYYPKYLVIRRSNCEVIDPTTCFTLVPSRDPHAVIALKAYCDACQDEMPGLAAALRAHFDL